MSGGLSKKAKGDLGEETAADFLRRNGYDIIERNYRHRRGEIDIVASENGVLVFVEVKYRRSRRFGAPEEAVTPAKQELLRRTAEGYAVEREIGERECRFDVVAVTADGGRAEIELFRNAF